MTTEDKKAWMKTIVEVGALYMLSALVAGLFGWDDDDKERFAKIRKMSGHLELPGTSENKADEQFNFGGFMELHTMSLMMQIRSENEQFIPYPGYGLDNMTSLIDLKSLAFGPTTDTYNQIFTDLGNTMHGDKRQFYARRMGPYEWQDQGGRKLWAHIAKSIGLTGSSVDPAIGITNFQKAQARKK
jgi:hypothetical protein